jgi:CO/xanthine dehydrogenase Mo-binding subunit
MSINEHPSQWKEHGFTSQWEYENYLELISTENGQFQPIEFGALSKKRVSRRDVLKGMGFMVVTLGVAGATRLLEGSTGEASAAAVLLGPPNEQLDSFLVIAEDNTVTVFTSKIDQGQGIMTGFMQIMAEELDVAFSQVTAVMGDTDLVPSADGGTLGSNAVSGSSTRWRHVAAKARAALLEMAAARFNVPVSQLAVSEGVITVVGDPSQRVTYGELIGGQRFHLEVGTIPPTGTLQKPFDQYKIVGQPIPRVDIPGKLTGEFEYVHDVRLPGMLYARAVRPRGQSYRQHSVLESVDLDSVADVKGLVKVVPISDMTTRMNGNNPFGGQFNFVGVVCEREEQAVEAAQKLKVTWATPPEIPADLYEHLLTVGRGNPNPTVSGDVAAALASATTKLEATYKFPFQMHASMGAVCAVADVQGDRATVWSSDQGAYSARTRVANALGLPQENVRIIWRSGAGSYGTNNGQTIAVVDAALLSQAVGRPVKVQWFREDTHGWESYGPLHLFFLKAGVDSSGKIVAWDFDVYGSGVNAASSGQRYNFGTPSNPSANFRFIGGNPTGGTFFLTAPLRAPNAPATTFASESFLDELAAAVRMDPVEFRLSNLDESNPASNFQQMRVARVLREAAQLFGWDSRPSPNPANADNRTGVVRGRGVGYGGFSNTHVAEVAEVEVDQSTGAVRVLRVAVAHDCGLIINPLSIREQIEGCVTQGTSRALYEEVKHDGYRVSSLDWIAYPYLKFTEFPSVESVLVDYGARFSSTGVGEPATVPIPVAIANAIFDATGARVRQIPLTPERVKAALDAR